MKLPGVAGPVGVREDMSWLTARLDDGRARIIAATVREKAGRWWVSFQLDIDRTDINACRTVGPHAPTCGIDLGLKTFAVIADDTGAIEQVRAKFLPGVGAGASFGANGADEHAEEMQAASYLPAAQMSTRRPAPVMSCEAMAGAADAAGHFDNHVG